MSSNPKAAEIDPEIEVLRERISLDEVCAARERIAPHLNRTPIIRHPVLCEETGLDLYIKHENHLPTGAFKIRGGLNLMAQLPDSDRARGVITATRGNHGQSIAMAASMHSVRAVVVVPIGNNPEKNAAMRAYGAELVEHGRDFDEAREYAEQRTREEGFRYIDSGNEPDLINGVGTYALEILEDLPEVDTIIVPVGGGSAVSGVLTVVRALRPEVEVIAVQAENAPSVYRSWKSDQTETTETANTIADGLATRMPFALPLSIMRDHLDDFVLVSEDEIRAAIRLLLRTTHNIAEGAGAASLAACVQLRNRLEGKRVACVLSGGNLDEKNLRDLLAESR